MKKFMLFFVMALIFILAACSSDEKEDTEAAKQEATSDSIIYTSSKGDIEVPANPQRVVALAYTGDLIHLGVTIVGTEPFSMDNPNFKDGLKNTVTVTNEDLEKIMELEPDLIIGYDSIENGDKLQEIAPTVLFTYGEYDYLQQHIELGKVLNKEQQATEWVADFKERAKKLGEEVKEKIGDDATITVAENYGKEMGIFGDAWGRGTELLYQEMGLTMHPAVKEIALEPGYATISSEVLGDYIGDYLVLSFVSKDQDTSFLEADWYQNIDAVKNNHVIKADAAGFYFNDATTLEYQLELFRDAFLNN